MEQKDARISVESKYNENLSTLFARMADDLTQLFDTKLSLLKVELKEELNAYIRGALMIAVGSIIAAVGFALLNVSIAFFISMLFEGTQLGQPARYALGFLLTSVIYLALGIVMIIVTKNRLAKQGIVPERSVAELKRDKEWLKKEI